MLENAVAPLKALRAMKDQADQLWIYLKISLDYEEYSTLVTLATFNYNALIKIKGNKPSKKVYFYQYDLTSDSEKSKDFNIDMLASTILANITKRIVTNNTSYSMPLEK